MEEHRRRQPPSLAGIRLHLQDGAEAEQRHVVLASPIQREHDEHRYIRDNEERRYRELLDVAAPIFISDKYHEFSLPLSPPA